MSSTSCVGKTGQRKNKNGPPFIQKLTQNGLKTRT